LNHKANFNLVDRREERDSIHFRSIAHNGIALGHSQLNFETVVDH